MGVGASNQAHAAYDTSITSIFVPASMTGIESMLKRHPVVRSSFVTFVCGKAWTKILVELAGESEDDQEWPAKKQAGSSSLWANYGYKNPFCGSDSPSEDEVSLHTQLQAALDDMTESFDFSDRLQDRSVRVAQEVEKQSLFGRDELKAVMVFALVPLFLASPEYQAVCDLSNLQLYSNLLVPALQLSDIAVPTNYNRLNIFLQQSVRFFRESELEDYLSNLYISITEHFKTAITNLPVNLSICEIYSDSHNSPVVFENSPAVGLSYISDHYVRTRKRSGKSTVGQDLHVLCAQNCSPGGVQQVERAVFGAKKYKRSHSTANGSCVLRAIAPLYNTHGTHVLSLSLQSFPFELSSKAANEEPFQQIEDLLALVPWLVARN